MKGLKPIRGLMSLKQIRAICFSFLFSIFSINLFAVTQGPNIPANATSASCNNATLETYSGTSNLQANWEANKISLYWYSDNNQITNVQSAATTCNYDGTLSVPSTPPTKTGYTFNGWVVRSLPSGYTRLQYLESTGTQYIDTGIILSSDNVIYEWEGKDNSSSDSSLFSAEYGSGTRTFSGVLYGKKGSRTSWLGSTQGVSMGYTSSDNAFHSWSFVINSDHTTYLVKDGTALSTISWSGSLNKSNTIAIYCNHTTSSFSQKASVAYKYFRITDNGKVVFNGIPAKR